jgi:hypothetical protein
MGASRVPDLGCAMTKAGARGAGLGRRLLAMRATLRDCNGQSHCVQSSNIIITKTMRLASRCDPLLKLF